MNGQHCREELKVKALSMTTSVEVTVTSWQEVEGLSAWTGKGEVSVGQEQKRKASEQWKGKGDVEEKGDTVVTKKVEERKTGSLKNEHDCPCSWRRNAQSARGDGME